jgi:hypothetical protein
MLCSVKSSENAADHFGRKIARPYYELGAKAKSYVCISKYNLAVMGFIQTLWRPEQMRQKRESA